MKGTPPAAVIYHAMPCRAVHTYTTMMIHGGGKAGRRLSLVLIDVIDIGIRRRADYSAVNNSTPPCCCRHRRCCSLPSARPLLSFYRHGGPTATAATLLPPPLRKHHLSPRSFRAVLPSALAIYPYPPTPPPCLATPTPLRPEITARSTPTTPPIPTTDAHSPLLCRPRSIGPTLQLVTPSLWLSLFSLSLFLSRFVSLPFSLRSVP